MAKTALVDRKIVSVTGNRQITIPIRYYNALNFGKEAECLLTDDAVVIRPLFASDDSFTMEILKDLVSQGYSGNELIEKVESQRGRIRGAVETLIDEADKIAAGKRKSATTEDVFGGN